MRVVIGGESGLIGSELSRRLRERGDTVVALVRRSPRSDAEVQWNPGGDGVDASVVSGSDAVVNLSGASIGRLPWTPAYKREILASRVGATRALVTAILEADTPPEVLVSASAVGIYGDRWGEALDESSPRGSGFLSDVTASWELEANKADGVTRVVTARTGLVVATQGVLKPLMRITRLGVSGPLAGGRQHWPWISLHDEVSALIHLIDSSLRGPVNLVGPQPSTSDRMLRHLAIRLNRPYWLPAPRFALTLALGDAGQDLLLSDQRASPKKLLESGFVFEHNRVEDAINAALDE